MNKNLETRLHNYILLVMLAAFMIGVEFYFEMNRPGLKEELCGIIGSQQAITGNDYPKVGEASVSISDLRNKIIIMFGVFTIVVTIVMTMFIKNITAPLLKIAKVAKSINSGDLTQYVVVEHEDEIGMVAHAINELRLNLQETTTFTSTTMSQTMNNFEAMISKISHEHKPDEKEIKEIRDGFKAVIEFVDSYTLLHVDDFPGLSAQKPAPH